MLSCPFAISDCDKAADRTRILAMVLYHIASAHHYATQRVVRLAIADSDITSDDSQGQAPIAIGRPNPMQYYRWA